MKKQIDAVFEGGGIRGIGYVGAIKQFEDAGYEFRNVAGSSAGAIVASLIASGFTAEEMRKELEVVDFSSFKEPAMWRGLGALGSLISATKNFGMYKADLFEKWLEELLARKGVKTFSDLPNRNLKLTATDVTEEKTIILPDSLRQYGINPDDFPVVKAVRMSMGIPVFYEPYEIIDPKGVVHYIVDGGLLTNYPVWLLDNGNQDLEVPVIGFRFIHHPGEMKSKKNNLVNYIKQVITTFIASGDAEIQGIMRGDIQRTVFIDTKTTDKNIGITDFSITPEQVKGLYNNGVKAGDKFLKTWDFNDWNKKFRR